ncbi:MAG: glycosyl hydrolase 108 family protein [Ahrensia sp.]|nr:glycosyl hydrolase 108 family protein [Ahrensia sp.]
MRLPYERALTIYKRNYWDAAQCATNLAVGVDRVVYDAAVNSGVSRARKWLLASVGDHHNAVTVARICDKRLAFVMALRTWKVFGKGWGRRIAFMKAAGLREAKASQAVIVAQKQTAQKSADKAQRNRDVSAGGGVVSSGGTATVAVEPNYLSIEMGLTLLAIIAALFIAAFLFQRWSDAKQDQVKALNEVL